jgi:hypothetical protein
MPFKLRRVPACAILFALFGIAAAAPLRAGDHFLAIGGGDSPSNNQISLEKNITFFQRVLVDAEGPGTFPDVLFSDGSGGSRDVQFIPDQDPPRLNLLLARVYDNEHGVNFSYRAHKLNNLRGTASRRGLDDWFNTTGKRLGEGDRLFIYFTGHGASGVANQIQNTTMSMWCDRPMQVTEFVGLLDRLSPRVQVVLIMVQCHSGGFANAIFNGGKAGSALSPARRCGFFATTWDRNAAGCTPDTAEDDYKDYSTYFFAALDGKTRTGKPVKGCDIDGDGRVSFAEAHAWVILHSDTIDIPVITSEALLRQFSKSSGAGLTRPQLSFDNLILKASLPQKAVLEGLSEQLKLTAENRYDETKRLADLLAAERKTVDADRTRKSGEAEKLARRIRSRLIQRWPELPNPWNPHVAEMLKQEGAQIQQFIERDSDSPRWELLRRDISRLDDRSLDLERKWVKCQRMLRMLETVALAANLERVAPAGVVERYKQLLEDEGGMLTQKVAVK